MTATGWLILFGILSTIIAIELYIGRKKNFRVYTMTDSLVNISCGILERVFDFFWIILMYFLFDYLYEHVALWHIPNNPFMWFFAVVVADFLAYWHHRLSHEINVFWAGHIVHHQSEQLNLTTVFRVSFFSVINRSFFFIWMPLVGFEPVMAVFGITFVGGFQFLTHSRLVPKLGFLEDIFSTPSNHRVHHARNEKYIDHNYAHVFIIWDKIFNTYCPEEEEPEYGITTGFESIDAYNAHLFYWKDMFKRAKMTKKWSDKIKIFIKPPSWTPADVGFLPPQYEVDENGNRLNHEREIKPEFGVYMLINNLITLAMFIWLVSIGGSYEKPTLLDFINDPRIVGLVGVILFAIYAHGRMLDSKPFAPIIDGLRLLLIASTLTLFFTQAALPVWVIATLWFVIGALIIWLIQLTSKGKLGSFHKHQTQTV